MIICWVTVCVAEALQGRHYRHYLLQMYFWNKERNLKMFSVLWKEQGDLYCGTPLFHHENRCLNCWGFQLTVVLSSVCDIAQKSPKQADTVIDSMSYGVEFSRMQEDNNGNRIAGMLAVTYKSRLWIISMLVAVCVVERMNVNTRIVQTPVIPRALHRNSGVSQGQQLKREELQWTVVTIKVLQVSATRKDKKYLVPLQDELSLPGKEQGREEGSGLSPYPFRNLFEERGTSNNFQAATTATNNFQAARTLLGSSCDLWTVTLIIFFQKRTDNSLPSTKILFGMVLACFSSPKRLAECCRAHTAGKSDYLNPDWEAFAIPACNSAAVALVIYFGVVEGSATLEVLIQQAQDICSLFCFLEEGFSNLLLCASRSG